MRFKFNPLIPLLAIMLLGLLPVGARDMGPIRRLSYFQAADANGVQQVYQLLLDGQSQPRQITQADRDVVTFGVSHDGLAITYLSNGQLWLQPLHTDAAEALTPVNNTLFFTPVFSPDGQYIAYASQGIWLYDLGARESRQILADVPLAADGSNMAAYRVYRPDRFVMGADGKASHLILRVGVWEWETPGVYNLATGVYQELEGQVHTRLLPLYGDKVLLYGNGGVAGEMALHLADSLDDINQYQLVVTFSELTTETLFAQTATEIHPGVVRLFGPSLYRMPDADHWFSFDYDLMNNVASDVRYLPMPTSTIGSSLGGDLSPDGALAPVYADARWSDYGSIFGNLTLRDLLTGAEVAAPFPATVGELRWQP